MASEALHIVYELEQITLPKSEKVELHRKGVLNGERGLTYFKKAGVFTCNEAIYFVLPWVTKNIERENLGLMGKNQDTTTIMLDTFFWLRDLVQDLPTAKMNIDTGRDLLYYSFLRGLERNLYQGLKNNVFRDRVDVINVIKGRWLIEEDIKRSEHPTKFTCVLNECDKNHPLLQLAREYCEQLKKVCSSGKLKHKATILERELANYVELPDDLESCLKGATELAKSDKRFRSWLPWVSSLKWILSKNDGQKRPSLTKSGVVSDVEFPSEDFFVASVHKIFDHLGLESNEINTESLLGGAQWCGIRGRALADSFAEADKSSQKSFLVNQPKERPMLIQCRYKNFDVVKTAQGIPVVRDFTREERIELFSHLMMMSGKVDFDSEFIFVFFPWVEKRFDRLPVLRLNCEIKNALETSLRWGKTVSNNNVRILFYAIDVMQALKEIYSGRPSHNSELERIGRLLQLTSHHDLEIAV